MPEEDWKAQLRADLERWGERGVRDDMNNRGALSTGGEARRQFVLKWLKEKDLEREEREQDLLSLTQKTFNFTRWTFYAAVAALVAAVASIAITLLHL
jgi:hypothetical protein